MSMNAWWSLTRWEIAAETGWSLEYIENLSFEDVYEWLSIRDANSRKSIK